ncbi:hypothetical protein Vafri_19514 [Volvox africanus]|nr:hypothetical protein Vafri_19514 [Volvox africanus]
MSVNHVSAVGAVGFGEGISVPNSASNHGAAASFAAQTTTSDPNKIEARYDQFINSDYLGSESLEVGKKVYLIVLNYSLPLGLLHAWSRASVRICADGGCNRLYNELKRITSSLPVGGASADGASAKQSETDLGQNTKKLASVRKAYIPDVVIGDLDSVEPDVRKFYEDLRVPFEDMSWDQDSNDLTKAIRWIDDKYIKAERDTDHQILVLGALGGRLDHTLANLNVLHVYADLNITLWGDGNLVRLVRRGKALIKPDRRFEGPTCGLIPIAGPVIATSSGLEWNVSDTTLKVGGLVSSSNQLTESDVEVTCDAPLLWMTEVREELYMTSLQAHIDAAAGLACKGEEQEGAGAGDTRDKPEAVAPMLLK